MTPNIITLLLTAATTMWALDAIALDDLDLNRIPGWRSLSSAEQAQKIRFTTQAYRQEALRRMLADANQAARALNLPETLPIEATNLTDIFITSPWLAVAQNLGPGAISTTNYNYSFARGGKMCYLTRFHLNQEYDKARKQYHWPLTQIDTNGAYQMAIQWMSAVSMNVKKLNACPQIEITPWFPSNANDFFVPMYRISWSEAASGAVTWAGQAYGWKNVAVLELILPSKTLLQLRVERPDYILRPSVAVTNLDYFLSQTNVPIRPLLPGHSGKKR